MPDPPAPETAVSDRPTAAQWITWLSVAIGAVALVLVVSSKTLTLGPLEWSRAIGLALIVVGFVGWTAARLELGKSFSVRAKATALVSKGVYAKIRNPVYVFGTVLIAGLLLWIGRPPWLLILVVIIPLQVMRARQEARVLEAKFGEEYRAYRAKTWF